MNVFFKGCTWVAICAALSLGRKVPSEPWPWLIVTFCVYLVAYFAFEFALKESERIGYQRGRNSIGRIN